MINGMSGADATGGDSHPAATSAGFVAWDYADMFNNTGLELDCQMIKDG
jgi:hypothetical protein